MAKKKSTQAPGQLEAFESALTKTEQFFEDNQKILSTIVLIILGVVIVYMGFKKFYIKPLEEEAQSQMFVAEQYFEIDSFNLALLGDGSNYGFLDIVDEYGLTKSGNLAKYYAGVSFLQTGDYEEAIRYLKKFNQKDKLVGAIANGALGDAYWEIDEIEKAIKYYLKAANYNKNDFTSSIYLLKAGYAYESLGDYENALKLYQEIKEKFPESNEARNIDKDIIKAQILLEQ